MQQAKRLRQEKEKKRKMLREMLPKLIVAIQQDVSAEQIREWQEHSKNFVEFLKHIAQWLGERESPEEIWLHGMCCMITDFAEAEKSPESLQTPREIFIWFAKYVERNLAKNETAWQSKLFSYESIQAAYRYLERLNQALGQLEKADTSPAPTITPGAMG